MDPMAGITLHEGTTFVVSTAAGDLHEAGEQGLYHEDTRFLCRFELLVDGIAPLPLSARRLSSRESIHFLTNPRLTGAARGTLGIVRRRRTGNGFHEDIDVESYGDAEASFTLVIGFEADFAHLFTVKQAVETGAVPCRPDELTFDPLDGGRTQRIRLGRDEAIRETVLSFGVRPDAISEHEARFDVRLARGETWHLCIDVAVRAGTSLCEPTYDCRRPEDPLRTSRRRQRGQTLTERIPAIESDHPGLARAYRQASEDLVSLRLQGEEQSEGEFTLAAGIPWFLALFGRDSLIASWQSLMHDPSLARGTLRALARLQGMKVDPIVAEEPGKILHEHRHGSVLGGPTFIPKFPYYGSVDSTPLFLITLSEYVRCTGDLALARELEVPIARAIDWIDLYGDADGDGFVEYERIVPDGLLNQGWKDSEDSIRFRDGSVARGAIALVEVQGYTFDAKRRTAEIYERLGDPGRADRLRIQASQLRDRVAASFRLLDRGYFAEALDGEKTRVDALTSNPGHLLWSGLLAPEDARRVATVLLSDAMFSGFGVRTMGTQEGGYNPISYHNGSVWPHDNALLVAGLLRYGLVEPARRIIEGLLRALAQFPDGRLPELFAGHPAERFGMPIEYPTANRPQAWASGALISLVRSLLGLDIDALERRLVVRPIRIDGLSRLTLRHLPVGQDRIDLEVTFDACGARVRCHGLPADWHLAGPGSVGDVTLGIGEQ